jgi:hypothetical protein
MQQTIAAPQSEVTPRTDVVIEEGVSPDVVDMAVSFGTVTASPSEPERAQPEARSLEREFDIADLRAYARDAAIRQGIDPVLFVRQITAESDFNPYAVSRAGAIGIAQIMPRCIPRLTRPTRTRRSITPRGSCADISVTSATGPSRSSRTTPARGVSCQGIPRTCPPRRCLSNSFGGGETKRYVARILGR